jgi:hypothetical protein
MTSRCAGRPSSAASSRSSKKLTQPTPRPSARAASHRLATASTLEKSAVCGWVARPSVCRPPRVRSHVTTTLTGVSRIDSILSWSNARARAAGRAAAKSSRCRAARAAIRSRRARSAITMKSHGCDRPTEGALCAAASTRPSTSAGTGSGRNPRRTSRRSAITR